LPNRLELSRLSAASRRLHAAATSKALLAVAAEEARRIVPAHLAVVSLSAEGRQVVGSASMSGKYAAWRAGKATPPCLGAELRPVRRARTYRMTQAQMEAHPAWPRFGLVSDTPSRLRGWLAAPLIASDGETLGFLQLSDREEGEFTEYDELLLDQLAGIVGLSLENRRHVENAAAAEARLNRAERMQAIGDLTGGVAHDFNNLLTIIIGSAEALVDALPASPQLLELAEVTLNAAERGAELTRRLLAFARRQQLEPRNLAVCQMLDSIGPLIRRAIGADIEVSVSFEAGLACFADPGQLESAILNLCINARDAMPRGGKLMIEARALDLDAPFLSSTEEIEPGRYVVLSVTDTGEGMPPGIAAKAFEPFFTTKAVGGTGLGLSMVYGFARQSGGAVKIYSEVGCGTAVKLYLPRTTPAVEELEAAAPAPGRGARILVVEDDPVLRRQVERQLLGLGYCVRAVEGGREAEDVLKTGARFDLVFTDVVMPGGMNGSELGRRAQALQPDLQVLLTSGYSGEVVALRDGGGFPTLQKPYRTATLSRRIEAVLGG
jgi:signal transduction histidine kinase